MGAHGPQTAAGNSSVNGDGGSHASIQPGGAVELVVASHQAEPSADRGPPEPAEPAGGRASSDVNAAGSRGRRFWRPFSRPRQQQQQVQVTPMALVPHSAAENAVDQANGTDGSVPGSSGTARLPAPAEAGGPTPSVAEGIDNAGGSSGAGAECLSAEGLRRRPSAGDGSRPGGTSDGDIVTPAGLDEAAIVAASDDSTDKVLFLMALDVRVDVSMRKLHGR